MGAEGAMDLLIDVTMRYYYNIKNALTSGDFRRNELRFFTERNSASMRQFLNNRLARMSIEVDMPEYMIGTYKSASTELFAIIEKFDVSEITKQMARLMIGVSGEKAAEFVPSMNEFITKITPYTRDALVRQLKDEFSGSAAVTSVGSKGKRAQASEVIGTHADFVQIYNRLLGAEDVYKAAIELQKTDIPATDMATRNMIKCAHAAHGTSTQMDDATKKVIYNCLRKYAETIDGYGVILQLLQTVEHNFVLCTSTLMEANRQ